MSNFVKKNLALATYHEAMIWYWWYLHTWLISILWWSWPKVKVTSSKDKIKYQWKKTYFDYIDERQDQNVICDNNGSDLYLIIIIIVELIKRNITATRAVWVRFTIYYYRDRPVHSRANFNPPGAYKRAAISTAT